MVLKVDEWGNPVVIDDWNDPLDGSAGSVPPPPGVGYGENPPVIRTVEQVPGTTAPVPVPVPGGGGGGGGRGGSTSPASTGGGGGGYGDLSAAPVFDFDPVPVFDPGPGYEPPDPFVAPVFHAPTLEEAMATPGYQFRLQSGTDALERSAAARGVLRTGGTLTDVIEYGQNFGAQEYENTFNRGLAAYGTEYGGARDAYDRSYTASLADYDRDYQGRSDAYAPQLAEWQMQSEAEMNAVLAAYQREWNLYTFNNLSAAQQAALNSGGGGGGSGYNPYPAPPPVLENTPDGPVPWDDGSYDWRKTGEPPVFY